jgi:hypothetical protein
MFGLFQQAYHIPGTLAADVAIVFTAFADCILRHVSAVGSNANDATLKVGTTTDDDGYVTAYAIGDSGAPVEKQVLSDFDGALAGSQFPRISDGDVVKLTLDYDGSSGTAAADVTIVLTFQAG